MADIYFNRFDLDIDHDAIDRDFILLNFKQKNGYLSYDKVAFLDALIATPECKALSACFLGGAAQALYSRKEFGGSPKAIIEQLELDDDIVVESVYSYQIHEHKLFQLFLNACSTSEHPRYRFNNLTGRLFITAPGKIFYNQLDASRIALEVKVKWGNTVDLSAVTFTSLVRYKDLVKNGYGEEDAYRKKQLREKERYLFDSRNSTFRRSCNQDKEKVGNLYVIMRPVERYRKGKKKHSIDFLSLNPKKYPATKIALFNNLLFSAFQKRFGTYIRVEQPATRHGVESRVLKPALSSFQALQHAPVRLVDKVGEAELTRQIQNLLKEEYGIEAVLGKRIKSGCINLHFIHDAGYYQANGEKDAYLVSTPDCVVQNITRQEYESNGENLLYKALQEAHLKYDISQRRLSVFDWQALGAGQPWHFALVEENKDTKELSFHFLSIAPDGGLTFRTLTRDLFSDAFHRQMAEVFSKSKTVEGVILDDQGQINAIEQTDLRTFPHLEELHHDLMTGTEIDDRTLPRQELLDFMDAFFKQHPPDERLDEAFKYLLLLEDEQVPLSAFKSFFQGKGSKKPTTAFVEAFRDRYGLWLKYQFRNKERTGSAFASLVNVHTLRQDEGLLFWANKDMGSTKGEFGKSNVVRRLKGHNGSPILFDKLLDTMAVDFVRVDAPTVIPFPFKLLREYQKMDRKEAGEGIDFGEFDFG